MKIFTFITLVIPVYAVAMENQLQITNRHLDTLQRPHITIINQLPVNDPHLPTTRIDISDETVRNYPYRPDDSTKTIYANRGIRFSPQTHKAFLQRHRLGMNNAGDLALISIYIHHANVKRPFQHIKIGKECDVQFGDTLTFTIGQGFHRDIVLKNNDKIVHVFSL